MGGHHINNNNKNQTVIPIIIIIIIIIVTLIKTVQTKVSTPLCCVYHCCQLKSSLDPKTRKKPRMVPKMTTLPVSTSAHAPQAICEPSASIIQLNKCCTEQYLGQYLAGVNSFPQFVY